MDTDLSRIALAAAVLASFSTYHALNVPRARIHSFVTALDRATPFLPVFSVPYLLYFPFLFSTVIYGVLGTDRWREIAFSLLFVQLAASTAYFFYQTHVPRPTLRGKGVFIRLVAFIYSTDRPYNTMPSLHVAHSAVCAYWLSVVAPAAALPVAVLAAFIVASTVLIKQHVIADAVGGALVAGAGVALATVLW